MKGLKELLQSGILWPGESSKLGACTAQPTVDRTNICGIQAYPPSTRSPLEEQFSCAELETKPDAVEVTPDLSLPASSRRSALLLAASECGTSPSAGPPSGPSFSSSRCCRFGLNEIDSELPAGGLEAQALHEFTYSDPFLQNGSKRWAPPLLPLLSLLAKTPQASDRQVLWIGKRCWPTAHFLARAERQRGEEGWHHRHFFLDPADLNARLWSTVQALHSDTIGTIVVDGSRFPFLASRRLQLAATHSDAFLFLFRPPWEIEQPSAARSKWRLSPLVSSNRSYRWSLELLRARGLRNPKRWIIERQRARYGEEHFVCVPSELFNRDPQEDTRRATG